MHSSNHKAALTRPGPVPDLRDKARVAPSSPTAQLLNAAPRIAQLKALAGVLNGSRAIEESAVVHGTGSDDGVVQLASEAPDSWEDLISSDDDDEAVAAAAPPLLAPPARKISEELTALQVGSANVAAFMERAGSNAARDFDAIRGAVSSPEACAAGVVAYAKGSDAAQSIATAKVYEEILSWTSTTVTVANLKQRVDEGIITPYGDRSWSETIAHTGRSYSFRVMIGNRKRPLGFEWHAHWNAGDLPACSHFKKGRGGASGSNDTPDQQRTMKAVLSGLPWGKG